MIIKIRDFIKTRPRLYDFIGGLRPMRTETERWLGSFSIRHGRRVSFIQIGANDGIRCDPVRRFIVRDRWEGIVVEPLPPVFEMLKDNYAHMGRRKLVFVNAAVSDREGENITFWSYSNDFLATLTLEEKMSFLRKSSLDRSLVVKYLDGHTGIDGKVEPFSVPVMSVAGLVETYRDGRMTDLVIIDAEGHDDKIIMGMDLEKYRPEAILYESHNLNGRERALKLFLNEHGYIVSGLGGDSVAVDGARGK